MPIPVTKYRCQFKCGSRAMNSVRDMEKHEAGCYKNEANKTCVTCINQLYSKDGDDEPYSQTWHIRGCKLSVMDEFISEIHDDLEVGAMRHIKPLFHCPNHNKTEMDMATSAYIHEVKTKIEARKAALNDNSIVF